MYNSIQCELVGKMSSSLEDFTIVSTSFARFLLFSLRFQCCAAEKNSYNKHKLFKPCCLRNISFPDSDSQKFENFFYVSGKTSRLQEFSGNLKGFIVRPLLNFAFQMSLIDLFIALNVFFIEKSWSQEIFELTQRPSGDPRDKLVDAEDKQKEQKYDKAGDKGERTKKVLTKRAMTWGWKGKGNSKRRLYLVLIFFLLRARQWGWDITLLFFPLKWGFLKCPCR